MYVADSSRREMTHQRPKVPKLTASLPHGHHFLEDALTWPSVRRALGWLTRPGGDGKSLFEKLCEHYDRPGMRWALPNLMIDLGLKTAHLDRETMKKNLFHHPPTVKALALTARSIATHGLTVPQRFTAPLFVVWNLTQACNLSCRHCYQNATHQPTQDELTREQKLDVIDQMGEEFVPFLALAGGEPMVSKDLWAVLERAQLRGLHVTIATNGTLLTPENCARLKEAGVKYVEVSLDSIDPEQHDDFRGQRGAWARSIQGIRNSVASGIRTGMACCFTRDTVDRADDMVNFAVDLGCKTFAFFNFIPVGRGREMAHEDLTPGQRELLLRKLQRHLASGRINVISTAPQFSRSCIVYGDGDEAIFATGHAGGGKGKKTMVLARYIGGCGAGRCYCSFQPDGTVTPCVYIPSVPVGNLRHQKLREIWDNALFATLSDREDRGDHCGVCDYRNYCGGCRARSLSYTGDIQAGDPGCLFNLHEWEEVAGAHEERVQIMSAAALVAAATGEVPGVPASEVRAVRAWAGRFSSSRRVS